MFDDESDTPAPKSKKAAPKQKPAAKKVKAAAGDADSAAAAAAPSADSAPVVKQVSAPPYGAAPAGTLKLISWNVASLRACLEKGFRAYVEREAPDMLCLQETKLSAELEAQCGLTGYHATYSHAVKSGYAGTAVYSRVAPRSVVHGLGQPALDDEGRVLTLEFDSFFLVNAYIPNAGMKLERLDHKARPACRVLLA
jgi:hypothetical protein